MLKLPIRLVPDLFKPLYWPKLAELSDVLPAPTSTELVGCVKAVTSSSAAKASGGMTNMATSAPCTAKVSVLTTKISLVVLIINFLYLKLAMQQAAGWGV